MGNGKLVQVSVDTYKTLVSLQNIEFEKKSKKPQFGQLIEDNCLCSKIFKEEFNRIKGSRKK